MTPTPQLDGEPGANRVVITLVVETGTVEVRGQSAFTLRVPEPGAAVPFQFRVWAPGIEPVTYTFRSAYDSARGLIVVLDDGLYERTVQPGFPDVLRGTIYTSESTPPGQYQIEIVFPRVEPTPVPTDTLTPETQALTPTPTATQEY